MREILGHKSYNEAEIIEFLKSNKNFTMCKLPHYRYQRVQSVCAELKMMGFIKKSGSTETGVSYVPTELFGEWIKLQEAGQFLGGYKKYYKMLNPKKPKVKICKLCQSFFETINYQQVFCQKECSDVFKRERYKKGVISA